jgi:hypothetical protein
MKHNQRGVSHLLLPLLIILVAAIAGTFYMVSSKADQVTATPTQASAEDQAAANRIVDLSPIKKSASAGNNASASGIRTVTLRVKAIQLVRCSKLDPKIYPPNGGAPTDGSPYDYTCAGSAAGKVRTSHADLMVQLTKTHTTIPAASCNGFPISKGVSYNFHNTRILKCKVTGSANIFVTLRGAAEFHYGKQGAKYAWPFVNMGIIKNSERFVMVYNTQGIQGHSDLIGMHEIGTSKGTAYMGSKF